MTNPKLRRGRHSEVGALYSVTLVCAARAPLFLDASLADEVSAELNAAGESGSVRSFAWVVMPDHLHWLFELRAASLGRVMQAVKSRTAIAINRRRGAVGGPVWQSGYYDHRLRSDEDLRLQARYIVANPLRRGLVQRIEHYPYWHCPWIDTQADLYL